MDLAKFARMPAETGGAFLKFTPNDNVKIVRFLYTVTPQEAVEEIGKDENGEPILRGYGISVRRKLFDTATRKVIWDTPEGKPTMNLRVAVYSSKTEFTTMTWDRSGAFGRDILLPLFEAAGGRVCDQVYRVSAAKAGTMDVTFSFFPLKDSENYAMPDLSVEEEVAPQPSVQPQVAPYAPQPTPAAQPLDNAPQAPQQSFNQAAPKKQRSFWEE